MRVKRFIKNLFRYLRTGGEWQGPPIVKVSVSFTQPNHRFEGKKVLVTGGGTGIGKEIAKEFLAEGAEVVITGRRMNVLEQASKELNSHKLYAMVWDISDIKNMHTNFEKAINLIGKFDIIVNNAGVYINNIDEDSYDQQCDTNTKGLFFICRAEANYMKSKEIRGHIVNISSIDGIKSLANPYSISKCGANCITKGFAKEYADFGIIFNAVAPGSVVTPMNKSRYEGIDVKEDAFYPLSPTKRYTLVEEVAALVLFLASESANSIVGQVIAVDGGRTIL